MKKAMIAFSSTLMAAASFSAVAQAPDWFAQKHPEMRVMERMRTAEAAGQHVIAQQNVVHAASTQPLPLAQENWFAVKHPEIITMERMRAQETAREHASFAMHDSRMHHPSHDTGDDPHSS